jgi:hypothetical protein
MSHGQRAAYKSNHQREVWSRRADSRFTGCRNGRYVKTETHRQERREARINLKKHED